MSAARWLQPSAVLVCGFALNGLACADPVHDAAVASLGPENPAVPQGPDHRPGQPCLVCHGSSGPASTQFSVGGTVYAVKGGSDPATGAVVRIEDIDGHVVLPQTNAVGNFYIPSLAFQPHYPLQLRVTSSDGSQTSQMFSTANRDGSCADCHVSPPGPSSPGPVFLFFSSSGGAGDGGAP